MTKYKCLKPLIIEVAGEDGFMLENESITIEVGSVWERDDTSFRFIGSPDSTRLLNDEYGWIEIHEENLLEHFIMI